MDLSRLKIDRQPNTPSERPRPGRSRSSFPVVRIAIVAALGFLGWSFRDTLRSTIDRFALPEVATAEVVRRSPAATGAMSGAAANGYVIARVKAALSADTPGRIVELNVVEGQRVPKGFVVARLFADEYRALLAVAEADVVAAKANLGRSEADLLAARADRDRLLASAEAAKAAIGEDEADVTLWTLETRRVEELVKNGDENQKTLEQAQATLAAAHARVATDRARWTAATAELAQSEARITVAEQAVISSRAQIESRTAARDQAAATLDKTNIRAPFDGIVVLKDAEVGEVVSPNVQAGGNARGSVATMVDFASLEVQAEVPEASIAQVDQGAPATVFLDAYPNQPYPARVDRIWPTANRQKATIEVRAAFEQRDDKLRPEMGCRIVFGTALKPNADAEQRADRILMPYDAVVRAGGKTFTFVVERDVARERTVELGERVSDQVVVKSGVSEGDVVIRNPPGSLQDGKRVRTPKN